jgi:hypothetical protein
MSTTYDGRPGRGFADTGFPAEEYAAQRQRILDQL